MKIQFENGNKSPFRNWKESSWKLENLEIMKIDKWLINKQNKSPFRNWKQSSWK